LVLGFTWSFTSIKLFRVLQAGTSIISKVNIR
jgi:hypothetical protein